MLISSGSRARRRTDIEVQLVMGGVERNPGPRRSNRRNFTAASDCTAYYDDDYADSADNASDGTFEHVLGAQLWKSVARTPAATPQDPPPGRSGRRLANNKDARYRESAVCRSPRAHLREMPYTNDGRPAARTCAQRQSEMFAEMMAYPRYDRDEINFEVWVAEIFADFMTASEAEVRRISLMKEEVVVWALRAALMADAYDLSMFHISFCPVRNCREFRETVALVSLHIIEKHPKSKEAKRLCNEGYVFADNGEGRDYEDSYYEEDVDPVAPAHEAASVRAPKRPPVHLSTLRTPATDGTAARSSKPPQPDPSAVCKPQLTAAEIAQQECFEDLMKDLRVQCELLERHERSAKRLLNAATDPSLVSRLKGQLDELDSMRRYVLNQQSEIIYEKALAAYRNKPPDAVSQVLAQMRRVLDEQQLIINGLTFCLEVAHSPSNGASAATVPVFR